MSAPIDTDDVCLQNYKYLFDRDLLRDKVAFVTGGGSGICFRITEVLMRHGCDTVIASRNYQRVEGAAKKLEAATGRRCLPVQMDVRKGQEVIAGVQKALDTYNKIDILVNGAAGNFLCPASGMSFNAFKTVMEIDAMGTFNCSKVVYDKYFKDHGGVIVNITATLHLKGQVLQTHAGCAKAAIEAMTRHLAVEWGQDQVRVVCVAPGPIEGTVGFSKLGGAVMSREMLSHNIPIQRIGKREEIGHLVLALASEVGGLVTGETLIADGGAWLAGSNSMTGHTEVMKAMKGKL